MHTRNIIVDILPLPVDMGEKKLAICQSDFHFIHLSNPTDAES